MSKPLVGVVISTRAEFNVMRRALEALRVMGVPYRFEALSPWRSPERLERFASEAASNGMEVLLVACSGSALLATHLAAYTNLPVVGVPIDATPLRGQDSLFSMAMVPPGMPIATVGINNSENAALLATQILALKHPHLRSVLAHRRAVGAQRVESMERELAAEYPDLCLPERTSPDLPPTEGDTDPGDLFAEAVTPAPPNKAAERIQPGATWRERSSGAVALVPTPVPQEPAVVGSAEHGNGHDQETLDLRAVEDTPDQPYLMPDVSPASRDDVSLPAATVPGARLAALESEPDLDTKVFSVDRKKLNLDLIDHVMMVLLEGGIVAIPTDTVYGLAADATNREAVERLCHVKGRQHQRTLGVLIHHPDLLDQVVREVPPALETVIAQCWPGALTIIFPKAPGVLSAVTRSDRIGVRIPSDPVCLEVISRIGRPIVTRNASLSADEPATSADDVIRHYSGHVDCILDAGDCPSSGASTVLSALGDDFEILREGAIPRERLKALLGDKLKG
ncbi:MAG: threonylcarbamoyl-AMP synthase [Candidatus Sumerlaeia bacterium]|nr:threonylcarbamoyl-AMP synthase [Candidatus Sumerlaeia bacterium]